VRAREELETSGARPRRPAQSGRDALTPAELRAARLAADGLANREIAHTLFVTVKTVETELGHAYSKLGIRSRRDLAAALDGADQSCGRQAARWTGDGWYSGTAHQASKLGRSTGGPPMKASRMPAWMPAS
jgi:DNA-binding CsgD family transcriptional regulator